MVGKYLVFIGGEVRSDKRYKDVHMLSSSTPTSYTRLGTAVPFFRSIVLAPKKKKKKRDSCELTPFLFLCRIK